MGVILNSLKMYEECFEKYENLLVLPKGIYQYHGHSFLIDEDLSVLAKEKVKPTFELVNDQFQDLCISKPNL